MKRSVNIEVTVIDSNCITIGTPDNDESITINSDECECLIHLLYKAQWKLGDLKRANEA
jgi:hypothetical protein